MNTLFRKILLTVIVVFGLVATVNGALAVGPVDVNFEKTPLFKEANFVPGNSVSRWIKATNNAEENLKVAIRTAYQSDPDHMGDFMGLKIKVGGAVLHNITLTQFLSGSSYNLPDLGIGGNAQYDLEVLFDSSAGSTLEGKSIGFDIVLDFTGSSGIYSVIDNGGGGGGGGYYLTPTPTSSPKVAGESVSQEIGQTGGQLGGRGGFVAAAETGPAGSISPTPTAPAVAGESTCSPIPWWPFGYVLLLIILGTAQKMGKRVSTGGIILQVVLLITALLWWWLEPCGAHFWVWPVLILIVFLVSLRFYLKKSSTEEMPA